jgi:hypothetical protein
MSSRRKQRLHRRLPALAVTIQILLLGLTAWPGAQAKAAEPSAAAPHWVGVLEESQTGYVQALYTGNCTQTEYISGTLFQNGTKIASYNDTTFGCNTGGRYFGFNYLGFHPIARSIWELVVSGSVSGTLFTRSWDLESNPYVLIRGTPVLSSIPGQPVWIQTMISLPPLGLDYYASAGNLTIQGAVQSISPLIYDSNYASFMNFGQRPYPQPVFFSGAMVSFPAAGNHSVSIRYNESGSDSTYATSTWVNVVSTPTPTPAASGSWVTDVVSYTSLGIALIALVIALLTRRKSPPSPPPGAQT